MTREDQFQTSRNAIKQWKPTSCLADYAKNTFIGLGFFNKKLF